MSATVKRKLFGMLALGAALAFAGAGCVGAPDDAEDDEEVAAAVSDLSAIDSDGPQDDADDPEPASPGHGSTPADDDGAPSGMHPMVPVSGPDPLPWVPSGEPEMGVGAPPITQNSGAPSTGNGGK